MIASFFYGFIYKFSLTIQIVVPCSDFCIPEKECVTSGESEDPCKLFKKMKFPIGEFFPPSLSSINFSDDLIERDREKHHHGCGCSSCNNKR